MKLLCLRQPAALRTMDNNLFLGIDTSNYTTSAALADEGGNIVLNFKRLLEVKNGERGLRQSDAVFQHIKNPSAASKAVRDAVSSIGGKICAVGVSGSPTYAEGSYMPCFMPGLSHAQMISAAASVPYYVFSHQAGHIMAALYSAGRLDLKDQGFAAFHVSGGTTDVIEVSPDSSKIIFPKTVGGSLDINAGQAIDRAGVMMGLSFPAGCEMERLAADYGGKAYPALCSVKGLDCNLSGLENKAARLYGDTGDKGAVAAYVLSSIRETLSRMLDGLYIEYGKVPVVFAGGVMSCKMLRESLSGEGRFFASPEYSSDNACGAALLAYFRYRTELGRRKKDVTAKKGKPCR